MNNGLFEIMEVMPVAKEDKNQKNYIFLPTDDGTYTKKEEVKKKKMMMMKMRIVL